MITDCVNAIAAVINSGNNNTIANISIRNVPNGIEINGGTRIGMAHFASVSGQEYVFTSGSLNTLMSPITSGATASRPANPPVRGYSYFDATLGIPIYWNGTAWIDSAGALV